MNHLCLKSLTLFENLALSMAYSADSEIAKAGEVSLKIYDMLGREVTTIIGEKLNAGAHHVTWDGRNSKGSKVVSGSYVCRLTAGDQIISQKMLLLK